MNDTKLLTIIIPTFNSDEYLDATFKCLIKQTNSNFKVVIIDDRSTDQTEKIARKYSEILDLLFIKKTKRIRKGAAASINYAFSKVTTDYWALLDSDAFLRSNWVATMIKSLEKDSSNNVFGGPIFASKTGGLIAYLIGLDIESRYNKLKEGPLHHLSTCDIAGKKEVLKYIKLNEELNYAYDHELSFQLRTNQIIFHLTKKTGCEHVNKSGFLRYFNQQYKIAKYHSFLSKKMPKQAAKGDEMSPNTLLLQPLALVFSLLCIFINFWVSIALIIFIMLLNFNFLSYSFKKNILFIFPVMLLIILKNIAWICGAFVGTVRSKV